ncbi:MAG: DUF5011 domain-containing protein [bacterium]|nr:DUF5011 domain-containing protein [bacterium]
MSRSAARILAGVFALALFAPPASAELTYQFERMWPTLQQPWYFSEPVAVAVSDEGLLYISDAERLELKVFTLDGRFLRTIVEHDDFFPSSFFDVDFDQDGNLYAVAGHMVVKLSPDGEELLRWGEQGTGPGQFDFDYRYAGVCVGADGSIYVADSDNHRIQKFTPDGTYLLEWGSFGTEAGQFDLPSDIAFSPGGLLYVTDYGNGRVQKFTSEGDFVSELPRGMASPTALAVDLSGRLFVVRNNRVYCFSVEDEFLYSFDSWFDGVGYLYNFARIAALPGDVLCITCHQPPAVLQVSYDGNLLNMWRSNGDSPGHFRRPHGMAVGDGLVYVGDKINGRIQVFTVIGAPVTEWQAYAPCQLALDPGTALYELDSNSRLHKWTLDGQEVWGDVPTYGSVDIAVGSDGTIYACNNSYDFDHVRMYSSNGVFLGSWGEYGNSEGQLNHNRSLVVHPSGDLLLVNQGRVSRFHTDGTFVSEWPNEFPSDTVDVFDIALDSLGHLYATHKASGTDQILVYNMDGDLLTQFGERGMSPGQFFFEQVPYDGGNALAFDEDGNIYVADPLNNRVQKFRAVDVTENSKAIVVAGGGAFIGNALWTATESCANFAYRSLTYQGFTKETIYYLSSDTDLDLDSNGVADDVDGDATNANLQYALETWAGALHNGLPTGDVVVYLVDHGGPGTFRMSGTETLASTQFAAWLDTLQAAVSGTVTVVYDACESGTFVANCAASTGYEDKRIVISSTSPGESAYFVAQGTVSFSNYFWTQIFNGVAVGDAFDLAAQALSQTYDYQTPLLEDNGNAVGNDAGDGVLAAATYIGNGIQQFWEGPEIAAVVGDQTINGTSTASLWADPVTDEDGVARVWAVIRPPDYEQESSSNPVTGLPSIDLQPAGGDRFEADYDAFTTPGTYTVLIYASDRVGNTSVPVLTSVTVVNPLKRRAVLVAGGITADVDWPSYERAAMNAYYALRFQGYDEDDVYFMCPMGLAGVDAAPSTTNIQWALSLAQNTVTQDMVLYMVGPGSASGFSVNGTEVLDAPTLDGWLDALQVTIPGKVTVVYDGDQSGAFLPDLTAPTGYEDQRIVIASASATQQASFLKSGTISFSKFFWVRVLNGADTFEGWSYARAAMRFAGYGQTAVLDDTGDGLTDPVYDGVVSRDHYIGTGILLAGDDPLIGSIVPAQDLTGTGAATLWVEDVTTTGVIDRVWAVLALPDGDVTTIELLDVGGGRYEAAWSGFTVYGTYGVAAFATDMEGNVSAPAETEVRRLDGPDAYEDDDTAVAATWIGLVYAGGTVQTHNFHDAGDADWVAFDSTAGTTVTIETLNCGSNCNTLAQLYRADGTSLIDEDAWGLGEYSSYIAWTVDTDGRYLVRVSHILGTEYGANTNYDLRMWQETGPCGVVPTLTVTVRSTMGAVALAGVPVKVTVFGGLPTPAVYTNSLGQALFPGIASYATYNVAITDGDYVPYTQPVYVPCAPYTAHAVQLTPLVTPPVLQVTSSRNVGAPTGAATFDVANTGADTLNWSASVQGGATSWLTIDSGGSGTDTGSIDVTYGSNMVSTSRNGYILVTATDSGGGAAVGSPVEVQVHQSGDTEAPTVTVLGANPVYVNLGGTFTDAGAAAADIVCGDLTGSVSAVSTVNTAAVGTWAVSYTATDTAGNVGNATRTVHVVDATPPVLTVVGPNPTPSERYSAYVDAGCTATDNWDGDISASVQMSGTVDTGTLGSYVLTYTVNDAAGNPATPVTRTVNVVATTPETDTVGPAGGAVSRDGIIVTILPGALTAPTLIGVDRAAHGNPVLPPDVLGLVEGTSFDVEPDGLTADGDGTLADVTIFYRDADQDGIVDDTNCDERRLVVVRVEEATGDEVILTGDIDTEANTITVGTESFSIFVIGQGDESYGLPVAWWAGCLALLSVSGVVLIRMRRRHRLLDRP